jgi:hypothetical protein
MLFLCIFLSQRLGLLIEEDERSPSILSERFVLTGSNRYATDRRTATENRGLGLAGL